MLKNIKRKIRTNKKQPSLTSTKGAVFDFWHNNHITFAFKNKSA
jgi:lysophospholipid acyltransferase (LPLAT)-like uncharacterized protein